MSTRTEYGVRDSSGRTVWPDADGELEFGDDWYTATVSGDVTIDETELLALTAKHLPGSTLVVRSVQTTPAVAVTKPLPTTPGSVIEKDGKLYALTDDGDSEPWVQITGRELYLIDNGAASWSRPERLAGAEVLFVPAG